MKNIEVLFILLLCPIVISAQSKTFESWKTDSDVWFNQVITSSSQSPGKEVYDAALKSTSVSDMYFESTGSLWGTYRLWQATGDFTYLDKAFDLLEADILGSVQINEFYEAYFSQGGQNLGSYWMPSNLPYKGFLQLPNYYLKSYKYSFPKDESFSYWFPNKSDYISNATLNAFSYNYIAAAYSNFDYTTQPLSENIYFRFAADLLRVLHNYPSVLKQISGNGKTYQQRYDFLLAFIEKHIWEKWVEFESSQSHKKNYVYRENTHMSSHLASIALSLFIVTNNKKYKEFVNEFLYDFGSHSQATNIPSGIGFLDQIETDSGGAKVWSSTWGNSVLDGDDAQDIAHAGPEVAFLVQCYQEGFGNIDKSFIDGLVAMVKNNVIIGNPYTSKEVTFRIDSGGDRHNVKSQMGHGLYVLAQYDSEILAFLERNISGGDMKLGSYAHGAYAASVLKGDGPVYPSVATSKAKSTDIDNGVLLNISPNPATQFTPITIFGAKPNNVYNLSIFNIEGQLMYKKMIEPQTEYIEYNLSSLSPNHYVVVLTGRDSRYIGRFIVQ